MMRHMRFGETGDLHDIEEFDWPTVKDGLRKGLYGVNDPLPWASPISGAWWPHVRRVR